MKQTSSLQTFGYTKNNLSHSLLASMNIGIAYPVLCEDVPAGATISNSSDIFARSAALVDPAFLDCDISVAHYFVSYESIDPRYKLRCRNFKRNQTDVTTPTMTVEYGRLYWDATLPLEQRAIRPDFAPKSLLDYLGFSLTASLQKDPLLEDQTINLNAYPIFAYHSIIDKFYTNSKFQDPAFMQTAIIELLTGSSNSASTGNSIVKNPVFSLGQLLQVMEDVDSEAQLASYYNPLALRPLNFEPDYFTKARTEAGSADVYLPGTSENTSPATVRNLLTAELIQKVGDMLYYGGYSYNDYLQTLSLTSPRDVSADEPIFLAGKSSPLQVSTVVSQAATEGATLGQQGGNTFGYIESGDYFSYTPDRPGLLVSIVFIRPSTYYTKGISRLFAKRSLGSMLIPQLADVPGNTIKRYELTGNIDEFSQNDDAPVFGFTDRYEEYRTRHNRVVGELRTTRQGWFIPRLVKDYPVAGKPFIQMNALSETEQVDQNFAYSPWVYQKFNEDHFFLRIHHNLQLTCLIPQYQRAYVW